MKPAAVFSVFLCNGYTKRGAFEPVPYASRPVDWQRRLEEAAPLHRKLARQVQTGARVSEATEQSPRQLPRIRQP